MEAEDKISFLDLLARVYSLEKILVDKKIISKEDLIKEYSKNTEKMYNNFLQIIKKDKK